MADFIMKLDPKPRENQTLREVERKRVSKLLGISIHSCLHTLRLISSILKFYKSLQWWKY